jgi:hypothetical protein
VHLNSAIEDIRVELRGVIASSWAGGWHLRTGKQFADAVHPHAGSAVGEGTTLATHDGGKMPLAADCVSRSNVPTSLYKHVATPRAIPEAAPVTMAVLPEMSIREGLSDCQ